jgi:poly(3-hydroxybutyrate) depolymerase
MLGDGSHGTPPSLEQVATAVESYRIEGGGHAWPNSAFSTSIRDIVGFTPTSIDATDISWDFFRRFSLPD